MKRASPPRKARPARDGEGGPGAPDARYDVPPSVLQASPQLLAMFDVLVQQVNEFARAVADLVRKDPASVGALIHRLAEVPAFVFQRWTLEILYLLSLQPELRYSQVRSYIPGISGRSLSLKLDELERHGLVTRAVSADRPPHVLYALTERGRRLAQLSFPMVLHLNLGEGLESTLKPAPKRR